MTQLNPRADSAEYRTYGEWIVLMLSHPGWLARTGHRSSDFSEPLAEGKLRIAVTWTIATRPVRVADITLSRNEPTQVPFRVPKHSGATVEPIYRPVTL